MLDEGSVSIHAPITFREGHDDEGNPIARSTTAGRLLFEAALPKRYVERVRPCDDTGEEEGLRRHRREALRPLPQGGDRRDARQAQGPLLPVRDAVRSRRSRSRTSRRRPRSARSSTTPRRRRRRSRPQFDRGIITDDERRQKEVEIWSEATAQVQDAMEKVLKAEQFNPIDMMVGSGARGNVMQVQQIAGMRGLVANPRGDMIPRPIKSNFREGLSVLEYFISTPRCPQGPRRHRAAYRRLGLPHAPTRRRRAGAHRPRGRTAAPRLGIWVENVMPTTPSVARSSRPSCSAAALVDDVDARRRHRRPRGTPRSASARSSCSRPTRRRPGAGALGAHLRVLSSASARTCYGIDARHRQARRPWARPSASSRPSRSASRARSSPCGRSTPVVSPVRTSPTVFPASSSCSRPARPRAPRRLARAPAWCASVRTRRAATLTIVADDGTEGAPVTRRTHLSPGSPTATRCRPASGSPATTRPRSTRRRSSRSRASARPSSTSSTRCRRCTASRACRSTTSTSR